MNRQFCRKDRVKWANGLFLLNITQWDSIFYKWSFYFYLPEKTQTEEIREEPTNNQDNVEENKKQEPTLDEINDDDDGLLNVNVKERRQYLMQILKNKQVFQTLEQNATLSRMAAKNAAVVKMAVQNLQNNIDLKTIPDADQVNENGSGDTDSILAIEASSRVKLMVSKFDSNKPVVVE